MIAIINLACLKDSREHRWLGNCLPLAAFCTLSLHSMRRPQTILKSLDTYMPCCLDARAGSSWIHNVSMWYIGSFISLCSSLIPVTCLFRGRISKMGLSLASCRINTFSFTLLYLDWVFGMKTKLTPWMVVNQSCPFSHWGWELVGYW